MLLKPKKNVKGGVSPVSSKGEESLLFLRFSREKTAVTLTPNPREEVMKKKRWILSFIMAMVFMMAGANLVSAYTITASSYPAGSSSAVINSGETSPGGMTSWIIGSDSGTSQLYLQWFWFKIDGTTTRLGDELNSQAPVISVTEITGSPYVPNSNNIMITYTYYDLEIITRYQIDGGDNPPYGHISENVQFVNRGSSLGIVTLYEYNDFDLAGTPENDTVLVNSQSRITQSEGNMGISEVSRSIGGAATGHYLVGEQAVILAAVTGGATLNDNTGKTEFNDLANAAWAFSWDFYLGEEAAWSVSKDKITVTPVPATLLLFGTGLFSLIGVGIRRRKS